MTANLPKEEETVGETSRQIAASYPEKLGIWTRDRKKVAAEVHKIIIEVYNYDRFDENTYFRDLPGGL